MLRISRSARRLPAPVSTCLCWWRKMHHFNHPFTTSARSRSRSSRCSPPRSPTPRRRSRPLRCAPLAPPRPSSRRYPPLAVLASRTLLCAVAPGQAEFAQGSVCLAGPCGCRRGPHECSGPRYERVVPSAPERGLAALRLNGSCVVS